MTYFKKRLHKNAGLTLVESTIVLAVISVIIGAIWVVSAVVYENARQYQANRQLQTIVQNVRQLYARVNVLDVSAGPVDATVRLDRQFAFPVEMRVNQGTTATNADGLLNHPWVSLATGSVKIFNRTASSFGVVFSSLPQKACIGLATKLTGGDVTNLLSVSINGGAAISGGNLPVSIVTANTGCSSATANTFEWIFDIRG